MMVTDRKAFESMVEKKAKDKAYPYHTKKRTVIFGGHRTFLRELRKMLPGLKYVNISNYGFNVDIIRNAEVVWVQTNCISHTQYARILKAVRTHNIQLRYFSYASARKCAEQIVREDRDQKTERCEKE